MKGEQLKGKLIFCPDCKAESKLNVKNKYDGFAVVGFEYCCSFCNKKFTEDAIPFTKNKKSLLKLDANREICEECEHYAVNLWVQKCILHEKKVTVLDYCKQFSRRKVNKKNENNIISNREE